MRPIRQRSGGFDCDDPLVELLYVLLRDHIQPADLEKLVADIRSCKHMSAEYSNGWLGRYAQDLAQRIRGYHE